MLVIAVVWLTRSPAKEKAWSPEDKYVAKYDPPHVTPKKTDASKTDAPEVDPPPTGESIAALMTAAAGQINAMRAAAKLKPIVADSDLSRGCQAHAEYMIRNLANLTTASAMNTEDANRAGFSDEGKAAAEVSVITRFDPKTTADFCLGRLATRVPLLHPQLERIGLGAHVSSKREWATVLDAVRGHGAPFVAYPAAGQKDVPLAFSGGPEGPPGAGFPVTLQFHPPRSLAGLEATLADENGNQLEILRWTPEKSAPVTFRAGLIGILPKNRLRPKSTYKARVAGTIDDRPFDAKWDFTTEDDGDDDGVRAGEAVERVNAFRKLADLPPVKLDDLLSHGCRAHAVYLALNARRPEAQGLLVHEEDKSLPGYTPEGKKAAKASDISIGGEPNDAIASWMATLYHRIPLLEPNLKSVGFGCARGDHGGWITVLDVGNGLDTKTPRPGPVLYPVENQTDVPLEFPGNELPNPIPDDATGRAGYPITVFFPIQQPLVGAAGKLEDAKGRPVECWFSSPESRANPNHPQGTTVCLIAKEPLQPEHRYRATFTGEQLGKPWRKSWTFTTTKKDTADSAIRAALERINKVRADAALPPVELDAKQSPANQAHADYLALNASKVKVVNDEDPALPGFTPAGQRAARNAAIFSKAPRTTTQVDDLMAGILFRGFFLDPKLRKVSLGCARETGGGWINVLGLRGVREEGTPVFCPASGQENVPLEGRDRLPDDPKSYTGFPITVWFPGVPSIKNVRATLAEATGATVDIWLSTPDSPFDASGLRDVIAIHPRRALRAGAIYTVNITADIAGAEWTASWRFSTTK